MRDGVFDACDTPLPCEVGASPFHIKGEFYCNLALTIAHFDAKSTGRLRPALASTGLLDFCDEAFLASAYYDILPLPRIMMVMAQVLGRDLRELTHTLGRTGVELQLKGIYKSIFSSMTTLNFAGRFTQTLQHLYDFGPVKITVAPDGHHATLLRTEVPECIAEWWCIISIPYLTVPLEHNGAKNLQCAFVVEPRQDKQAGVTLSDLRWDLSWD